MICLNLKLSVFKESFSQLGIPPRPRVVNGASQHLDRCDRNACPWRSGCLTAGAGAEPGAVRGCDRPKFPDEKDIWKHVLFFNMLDGWRIKMDGKYDCNMMFRLLMVWYSTKTASWSWGKQLPKQILAPLVPKEIANVLEQETFGCAEASKLGRPLILGFSNSRGIHSEGSEVLNPTFFFSTCWIFGNKNWSPNEPKAKSRAFGEQSFTIF